MLNVIVIVPNSFSVQYQFLP